MIQADLRVAKARTSIRMKVGEVGETNARDARASAKALIGRIEKGDDPRPPRAPRAQAGVSADASGVVIASPDGMPTFREAWLRFKASHLERKKRAAGTVRGYTDHMERLFADWLDRPLSEFADTPLLLANRHKTLSGTPLSLSAKLLVLGWSSVRSPRSELIDRAILSRSSRRMSAAVTDDPCPTPRHATLHRPAGSRNERGKSWRMLRRTTEARRSQD